MLVLAKVVSLVDRTFVYGVRSSQKASQNNDIALQAHTKTRISTYLPPPTFLRRTLHSSAIPVMPRSASISKLPATPPSSSTTSHAKAGPARAPLPKSLLRADLRKTRAGVWAVGVAVIAACGAISGAYLKTWAQERRKTKPVQPPTGAPVGASGAQSHTTQEAQGRQASSAPAPAGKVEAEVDMRDIDSAIRTLSNRRGALVMRKMQEEGRLERLKERMRVKAEIEARRAEANRHHVEGGAER
jgi:hypothetical protein